MPDQDTQTPSVIRVVEIDSQKIIGLEKSVQDVRAEQERLRSEADVRKSAIDRIERTTEKLDEAIRGNGKAGLNTQVAQLSEQFNDMQGKLNELVDNLQDIGAHVLKLNTAKLQAITREQLASMDNRAIIREEIERAADDPGGWQEFRKTWLFPVVMMVISALVSGALTYLVVATP